MFQSSRNAGISADPNCEILRCWCRRFLKQMLSFWLSWFWIGTILETDVLSTPILPWFHIGFREQSMFYRIVVHKTSNSIHHLDAAFKPKPLLLMPDSGYQCLYWLLCRSTIQSFSGVFIWDWLASKNEQFWVISNNTTYHHVSLISVKNGKEGTDLHWSVASCSWKQRNSPFVLFGLFIGFTCSKCTI